MFAITTELSGGDRPALGSFDDDDRNPDDLAVDANRVIAGEPVEDLSRRF
jgi:hypothetical protein